MRKWLWGIAVIIVAVLAYLLIPIVDDDPATKPDIPAAIDGIKDGVNIINGKEAAAPAAPAPEK